MIGEHESSEKMLEEKKRMLGAWEERIKEEDERIKEEDKRVKEEKKRIKEEDERIKGEDERIKDEDERIREEDERIKEEYERIREEQDWIKDLLISIACRPRLEARRTVEEEARLDKERQKGRWYRQRKQEAEERPQRCLEKTKPSSFSGLSDYRSTNTVKWHAPNLSSGWRDCERAKSAASRR